MRLVVLCVYSFICARDVEILPRDRVSLRLTRICGLQRGRLKPAASHRSEMRCRRESADRAPAFVLPFSSATTLMAIMRFTVLLAVSSRLTVAYTIPFGMPRTATMATCAPPLARSMPVRCSGHGEEREPSPYNSRGCHLEWLGRRPSQCG
jgi:hypothetical protein